MAYRISVLAMVPRGSFSAPPGTKPFPARACEVFPAAFCTPEALRTSTRTSDAFTLGAVVPAEPEPEPPFAGGAVVVVGMGAWPRSTASTASASGCLTVRKEPTESPIFHGSVSNVGPPLESRSPRNACTSWLNAGRSKAVSAVRFGIILSARSGAIIGSSTAFATAMPPSFLMKSCWRAIRSMSACGLASRHRPSMKYSRWRDRTYANAGAPSRW